MKSQDMNLSSRTFTHSRGLPAEGNTLATEGTVAGQVETVYLEAAEGRVRRIRRGGQRRSRNDGDLKERKHWRIHIFTGVGAPVFWNC